MDNKSIAAGFSALAQETRVALLQLLAPKGVAGMAPAELAAQLGLPASTLSFHLSALEQAGLLAWSRRGRQVTYAVRADGLRTLQNFLAATGGRSDGAPTGVAAPGGVQ